MLCSLESIQPKDYNSRSNRNAESVEVESMNGCLGNWIVRPRRSDAVLAQEPLDRWGFVEICDESRVGAVLAPIVTGSHVALTPRMLSVKGLNIDGVPISRHVVKRVGSHTFFAELPVYRTGITPLLRGPKSGEIVDVYELARSGTDRCCFVVRCSGELIEGRRACWGQSLAAAEGLTSLVAYARSDGRYVGTVAPTSGGTDLCFYPFSDDIGSVLQTGNSWKARVLLPRSPLFDPVELETASVSSDASTQWERVKALLLDEVSSGTQQPLTFSAVKESEKIVVVFADDYGLFSSMAVGQSYHMYALLNRLDWSSALVNRAVLLVATDWRPVGMIEPRGDPSTWKVQLSSVQIVGALKELSHGPAGVLGPHVYTNVLWLLDVFEGLQVRDYPVDAVDQVFTHKSCRVYAYCKHNFAGYTEPARYGRAAVRSWLGCTANRLLLRSEVTLCTQLCRVANVTGLRRQIRLGHKYPGPTDEDCIDAVFAIVSLVRMCEQPVTFQEFMLRLLSI